MMRTLRSFVVVTAGVGVGEGSVGAVGESESTATVGHTLASVTSVRSDEIRKDMVAADDDELDPRRERGSLFWELGILGQLSSSKAC